MLLRSTVCVQSSSPPKVCQSASFQGTNIKWMWRQNTRSRRSGHSQHQQNSYFQTCQITVNQPLVPGEWEGLGTQTLSMYQSRQKIWLSTRDNRLGKLCKKLSPHFIGPFMIREQVNHDTYQLQLPSQHRINPNFHVSLLKPHCSSPSSSAESVEADVPVAPGGQSSVHYKKSWVIFQPKSWVEPFGSFFWDYFSVFG